MTSRRLLVLGVAVLLFAGGCGKQQWRTARRVEDLRGNDRHSLVHVVAAGETLRGIADLYYGDPERAADVAVGNGLDDPDLLQPGQRLTLVFTAAEWQRAGTRRAALTPYNEGVLALEAGRLEEAEAGFRRTLDLAPDFTDARYNLALVLLRRGRNEAAAELLTAVLAVRPDDPEARFALGNALFYQTRYDEAAAAFRQVLNVAPRHLQAAYSLARALTEADRAAEAVDAWRAYLALDGDSVWAARAREQLKRLGA